jgi:hypothetical protein
MKNPLWERLPTELQTHIDELLADDRKLGAIEAIMLNEPRPELHECMELLVERCAELGEPWVRPSAPLNLDALVEKIAALPHPPDAIEGLWDGDTDGWFVCLAVVTLRPKAEHSLGFIRHGTDMRVFRGQVPPWPEAYEAATIGGALAERLGVPFHFTSPDSPGIDLPRWWDGKA